MMFRNSNKWLRVLTNLPVGDQTVLFWICDHRMTHCSYGWARSQWVFTKEMGVFLGRGSNRAMPIGSSRSVMHKLCLCGIPMRWYIFVPHALSLHTQCCQSHQWIEWGSFSMMQRLRGNLFHAYYYAGDQRTATRHWLEIFPFNSKLLLRQC